MVKVVSGGKSVGKNEWTRAKLFNGLHATAERRAKRTTWIYAKRVNFMFRERATLATLPLPFPSRAKDTADRIHLRSSCVLDTSWKKGIRVCSNISRRLKFFNVRLRKRPRESLEDISVRSRASGLRNDRWARVFSRVTEKVSFLLPFLGGCVKSFSIFFVIQVSLSVTFFFPSMIDEIIIIIIVATRVYKFFGSWIELFDNNNFNYQRYWIHFEM